MDYHEAIHCMKVMAEEEVCEECNYYYRCDHLKQADMARIAISAMEELGEYKKLKEAGRLIKLPCAVGDTVYEIIHDDIPETIDYICKYTVDDISANAINFAGDWNPLDSIPNVFFSREEAEEALMKLKEVRELK